MNRVKFINGIRTSFYYEICGKGGEIIDTHYESITSAIKYAIKHNGYSINRLWIPIKKNNKLDYGGEILSVEIAWERE